MNKPAAATAGRNFRIPNSRAADRASLLCRLPILNPGNVERVLRKDRSVCGTDNLVAFAKLQRLLVMYFAMRQKLGERLGEVQAAAIERYVVDRLRCAFPDLGSSWPP